MVAAEPLRETPGLDLAEDGIAPPAGQPDTRSMSVKEIRDLLKCLAEPDVELFCRLTRDPRSTVRDLGYSNLGRKRNLAANEDLFREGGVRMIAGADEAGRGSLAGPLVAAAVMFEPGVRIKGVNDSKVLLPERREELYSEIIRRAVSISVVSLDAGLIDRWGLQLVNKKALADALTGIRPTCDAAICDHFQLAGLGFPTFGIPHADAIFHSVAAASIVAKVERDRVMRGISCRFPGYGFMNNKGYATEEHMAALVELGPCEIHRLSFASVSPDAVEVQLWDAEDEP